MVGRGNPSVDREAVLSKVSEADLASFYLPELKCIPGLICSPLRSDKHPSMGIYSKDGTKIYYKDYANGDGGNIYSLLMKMFNKSYDEVIHMIAKDLVGKGGTTVRAVNPEKRLRIRSSGDSPLNIRSQMREWNERDFRYWESYGITKPFLLHADIYPISYIFITSDSGYTSIIQADEYAYTFLEWKDGKCTEKIYQPFNEEGMKWRSGHDRSVWDFWSKLPKTGERVIITSSRKDALCIWSQVGIPSVSLQSENTSMKPQVIGELKKRFKKVYVLYDNDFGKSENHGRIDGQRVCEEHGLIQIEIPESYGCKDISDLYHKYRGNIVRKVLKELLETY